MTSFEFRALLDALAEGWRARDYARVALAFAEDVHYLDPTRYHFRSRAALLAFFQADEGYPQMTTWHTVVFDEAQQVGAAEYTYDGTHRYHGVTLVRVAGGLITHWREYQHVDARPRDEFVQHTSFPG